MSVAVGIESKGGVWLAADSYMSSMDEGCTLTGKIFMLGDVGFGVVGSMRHAQVIEYHLGIPKRTKASKPERWAIQKLVPALRELFEEHGLSDGAGDDGGADLIVAVAGQLLVLQGDWAIYRPLERYAAVGSGSSVALGAMHAAAGRHGRERAEAAVRAACHHVPNVAEPIHVLWVPA